jgi:hypothetical protein
LAIALQTPPAARAGAGRQARGAAAPGWLPSLGEAVFASVLLWLVAGGAGARALLSDGDTGWHIRVGEYILQTHRLPAQDLFSYSKPGAEWFAWEWGSDVLLALAHRAGGLGGVVLLAAVVIAATSAVLFQFLLWQRSNVLVAVLVTLAAASASTLHWLARPHLFTCLLFLVALWVLEADRRRPGPLWWLVPLAALWVNLHGGFAVLPALVACQALGAVAEHDGRAARRYGGAALAVAAATLANPYGWRLHAHIVQYLGSDFIRGHVEEFQAPRFRGESLLAFETLLFTGLVLAPRLWARRERGQALLLVALAHAALGAVRHVLLYALAAAPVIARELTGWLEGQRGGWWPELAALGRDLAPRGPGRCRAPLGALAAAASAAGLLASGAPRWRMDFPGERFPLAALAAVEKRLVAGRIFTSDQWADYLIYRYWPRVRVFIDGRSDFYGRAIGQDYLDAMGATHRWREVFDRYHFEVALLPAEWPLATVLKAEAGWRLDYDDGRALVLSRVPRPETSSATLQAPTGETRTYDDRNNRTKTATDGVEVDEGRARPGSGGVRSAGRLRGGGGGSAVAGHLVQHQHDLLEDEQRADRSGHVDRRPRRLRWRPGPGAEQGPGIATKLSASPARGGRTRSHDDHKDHKPTATNGVESASERHPRSGSGGVRSAGRLCGGGGGSAAAGHLVQHQHDFLEDEQRADRGGHLSGGFYWRSYGGGPGDRGGGSGRFARWGRTGNQPNEEGVGP